MTTALQWLAFTVIIALGVGWLLRGSMPWSGLGAGRMILRVRALVFVLVLLATIPVQVVRVALMYAEIRSARREIAAWVAPPAAIDRARRTTPWRGWQVEVRRPLADVLERSTAAAKRAGWEAGTELKWVHPGHLAGGFGRDSTAVLALTRGDEHIQILVKRASHDARRTVVDFRPTDATGAWLR